MISIDVIEPARKRPKKKGKKVPFGFARALEKPKKKKRKKTG